MKAIVYEGIRDTRNTADIITQGTTKNNGNDQSNAFDNQDYSSNIFNDRKDTYIKIILKP
ncbi:MULTISPECIES: hypothetical protein [unclassified Clostridium]|uniref:hypothetical protein n=1 Tax=unclassified Clostridium TaxID=2614128 RepID=UPI00189B60BC|nr:MULTISPECIES: hypothetical protein [unclassified Clostridium]MCR1952127.1 hypothetical protein [Clostridium sp. DSM 100503]